MCIRDRDYFRLYEITAKAVKAVDDKLKVGGPATSNSKWVAAFVDYCKAHDAPVDFITTHQYAGDPISEVLSLIHILHDLQGGTTELEKLQQKVADAQQEFDHLLDLSLEMQCVISGR